MKRFLVLMIFTITGLFLNATVVGSSEIYSTTAVSLGIGVQSDPTVAKPLVRLSDLLAGAKRGDLSFCLGYIRKSKCSNYEIVNFILTWSPDAYRKQIPSVFRSKIDRVVRLLRTVDYQELIIDIDFIKNSQLTVSQMVKMIKGTQLGKKP